MKNNIQVTSIISYYEVLTTLGKRQKEVLSCLKHYQPANIRLFAGW